MYCSQCGVELPQAANFCPSCGTSRSHASISSSSASFSGASFSPISDIKTQLVKVAEYKKLSVTDIQKKAEAGDMYGQYELGRRYRHGESLDKNPNQALELYRLAADQGHAWATYAVGNVYEFADADIQKNEMEAVKWYEKAAQMGLAEGQTAYAWMLENGRGVGKSQQQAIKWYEKAALQDHVRAEENLGRMLLEGRGTDRDNANGFKWILAAAEKGRASAQLYLGWLFEMGTQIEKNPAEAAAWYRKAAEAGNAAAQCNLGGCYWNGFGVPMNGKEAIKWYRLAAEQGNLQSIWRIAEAYHSGLKGVEQNISEARAWYSKLGEKGYKSAQFMADALGTSDKGKYAFRLGLATVKECGKSTASYETLSGGGGYVGPNGGYVEPARMVTRTVTYVSVSLTLSDNDNQTRFKNQSVRFWSFPENTNVSLKKGERAYMVQVTNNLNPDHQLDVIFNPGTSEYWAEKKELESFSVNTEGNRVSYSLAKLKRKWDGLPYYFLKWLLGYWILLYVHNFVSHIHGLGLWIITMGLVRNYWKISLPFFAWRFLRLCFRAAKGKLGKVVIKSELTNHLDKIGAWCRQNA